MWHVCANVGQTNSLEVADVGVCAMCEIAKKWLCGHNAVGPINNCANFWPVRIF